MSKKPGYPKDLLVLPFDHRGSFQSKMFGIHGTPTPEQTKFVASYKMMIFEAFERAVASGLPKDKMGILTDEQFGDEVLLKAKSMGFTTCIPAEKSGQDEFDFEYGKDYQKHIQKYSPNFVKVLVRYNPEEDAAMNQRQAMRLAELSRYVSSLSNSYFMFELLVPPTPKQLDRCKGDKAVFDVEMRPKLMIQAIQELQDAGIEADVWKIEGLDRESDFNQVSETVRRDGRDQVGCIVLGRGENDEKVVHWLKVGRNVKGVIGFAVGRTVFWDALKGFKEGKHTRDQAIDLMATKYKNFCNAWLGK